MYLHELQSQQHGHPLNEIVRKEKCGNRVGGAFAAEFDGLVLKLLVFQVTLRLSISARQTRSFK